MHVPTYLDLFLNNYFIVAHQKKYVPHFLLLQHSKIFTAAAAAGCFVRIHSVAHRIMMI